MSTTQSGPQAGKNREPYEGTNCQEAPAICEGDNIMQEKASDFVGLILIKLLSMLISIHNIQYYLYYQPRQSVVVSQSLGILHKQRQEANGMPFN